MSDSRSARDQASREAAPVDRWSAVLAGAVLFLYLVMLCPEAYPGCSADLIVKALGLEPRLSPSNPFWFWLTSPLASLKAAAWSLNAFSAACGAGAVYLLSWLLWQVVSTWNEARESDRAGGRILARLAALAGGACLAFTPPFWQAATRAHTGTLDALLLLAWGCTLVRFVQSRRLPWAYAFMALAGLGAVECVSFLWLALPAALSCAWMVHRHGRLSVRRLAALAATAAAVFILFTFLQAQTFIGKEGHRLTGSMPFWGVVFEILRGHYLLMRQGLTLSGWLVVFLTLVLPWLACAGTLFKVRSGRGRSSAASAVGLNALFTLAAIGAFLDAPFSAWSLYREQQPWLIPYVLSASAFGWLTAYWYRFATQAASKGPASETRRAQKAVVATVVLLLLGGFWSNRRPCDGRSGAVVGAYAHAVIETLGNRTWLLTGGNLDSPLIVAAHSQGKPVRIINLFRMRDALYRDFVAGWFDDPQIGNACRLGLTPLVRDWFGSGTNVASTVAVLALPDIWYAAGRQPVPNLLTFVCAATNANPSPETVWREHESGWGRLAPLLAANADDLPSFAAFRSDCRRHAGMIANNLGVWLEDHDAVSLAIQAYNRSRAFDEYNVSALLNLGTLAQRGLLPEGAAEVRAELAALAAAKPKFDWWSLSRRFGYVRKAEAYVALGSVWALSGQPSIFATGLRNASALTSDPAAASALQLRLADAYAQEGRGNESRALYAQRLSEHPDDPAALLGMARLASEARDLQAARAWLARIDAQGTTSVTGLGVAVASAYSQIGDLARARVIVQESIEISHEDLNAWSVLAGIALEQRDEATVDICAREFLRLERGRGFHGAALDALRALSGGKTESARRLFEEALRFRPRSVETLDRILRLDHALGPRPPTEENARLLASLDSRNAFAPYMLGALSLQAGDLAAAKPWLEKSVALAPSQEALNDLAWVLYKQGDTAQAEIRVRAALEMAPRFAAAWDTLGMLLSKSPTFDEAARAFEQALRHGGRQPLVLIHLAQVRLSQGDRPAARTLIAEAAGVKRPLDPAESAALQAVRDALNQTAKR